MIARSHEADLVDTWRADSQSLSVARARNYPMCENSEIEISHRKFVWTSSIEKQKTTNRV